MISLRHFDGATGPWPLADAPQLLWRADLNCVPLRAHSHPRRSDGGCGFDHSAIVRWVGNGERGPRPVDDDDVVQPRLFEDELPLAGWMGGRAGG